MSLRSVGAVKDTTTVTLYHPATNEDLKNADKSPMTITLHGPYSQRYKSVLREQQQRRSQALPPSQAARPPALTADELDAYSRELLEQCIEDWKITLEGDDVLPFTPENVQLVLDEFPYVRDQISAAMGDVAGFLVPSPKH